MSIMITHTWYFVVNVDAILIMLLVIIFPLDIIVAVATTLNNKPSLQKKTDKTKQKQPPELFYKKRCSYKFRKILRKRFVPETLAQVFSSEFCEIFKNAFFTENLWTTASEKIF